MSFDLQPPKARPSPKPDNEALEFASQPVLVQVVEDFKDTITFWMAVASTASGILSAVGVFVKFT